MLVRGSYPFLDKLQHCFKKGSLVHIMVYNIINNVPTDNTISSNKKLVFAIHFAKNCSIYYPKVRYVIIYEVWVVYANLYWGHTGVHKNIIGIKNICF